MCTYELVHSGPFANIYYKNGILLKVYPLDLDSFQNTQNILSCTIATNLSTQIPQFVPHVFEMRINTEDVFILMEKLIGINLSVYLSEKWVANKNQSEVKWEYDRFCVLKIVTSLIRGLFAMHNAGYGHFDFHKNNIMIQHDYTIKIIDFDTSNNVNMRDPGDGISDWKETDYYHLKCHVAQLIFDNPFTNLCKYDILKMARNFTVENVIEFHKDPDMALSIYNIYISLGSSRYESEM